MPAKRKSQHCPSHPPRCQHPRVHLCYAVAIPRSTIGVMTYRWRQWVGSRTLQAPRACAIQTRTAGSPCRPGSRGCRWCTAGGCCAGRRTAWCGCSPCDRSRQVPSAARRSSRRGTRLGSRTRHGSPCSRLSRQRHHHHTTHITSVAVARQSSTVMKQCKTAAAGATEGCRKRPPE